MIMGSYKNADGLYIKTGTDKATPTTAGEFRNTDGNLRKVEIKLDLTALTATETILNDVTMLPAGARIVSVETVTHTAAATGTAIDVGLIRTDRTTELDYDGLLAAAPTANMNAAGERSVYQVAVTVPTGLTGTGALVGTTLAYNGYISASRTDATAFTAGIVYLTVQYYMP
jgi:hypothetical protein